MTELTEFQVLLMDYYTRELGTPIPLGGGCMRGRGTNSAWRGIVEEIEQDTKAEQTAVASTAKALATSGTCSKS